MNLTLRRGVAAAAVTLATAVVSSCGFEYATDAVYTPSEGVNSRSGSVDVLHALVVSGADGSGTFIAGLANNRPRADSLTEVTGAGEDQGITVQNTGEAPRIPANGFVQLADTGTIAVRGSEVRPGRFVTLRLSFQNAESVTLEVPVVARTTDYTEVPVPETASPSPTESPAEPAH